VELKSSSDKNHQLGLIAEYNVKKLLETKGWILILHRFKTRAGEIDLIFEKEEKILLIEVKKLTNSWRSFQRIRQKQLLVLKTNRLLFLLNFKDKEIESYVAWVSQKNVITFCSVD
jgi:Holliday junction resolvase-like predicted endonuclease